MTFLDSQVLFSWIFAPRETYPRAYSQNEIYDIGTEILLLTKNDHNSTQKAPKSIIPQEIKSAGHSPSSGSVKSRFRAIFKKRPSWIRRCCFHGFLPPEGGLTHESTLKSKDRNSFADENDHNLTQKARKFCRKSIIPQEIKSAGHSPVSRSVKARFKATFKKWPAWIRRCCLRGSLPPEGD